MPVDEEIRKENNRKKAYLWGYKDKKEDAESAGLDVDEFKLSKICPSLLQDGMPRGSNSSDLSDYMAAVSELEARYIKLKKEELEAMQERMGKIRKLEDRRERKVLELIYIRLLDWRDVCKRMGCKTSRTDEIHRNALRNLKI